MSAVVLGKLEQLADWWHDEQLSEMHLATLSFFRVFVSSLTINALRANVTFSRSPWEAEQEQSFFERLQLPVKVIGLIGACCEV